MRPAGSCDCALALGGVVIGCVAQVAPRADAVHVAVRIDPS
jgi:hypothetical protein